MKKKPLFLGFRKLTSNTQKVNITQKISPRSTERFQSKIEVFQIRPQKWAHLGNEIGINWGKIT